MNPFKHNRTPLEHLLADDDQAIQFRKGYGNAAYNDAINDAIAAIDRLWDLDEDFPSSLHIKIENELDKLKKI